MPVMLLPAGQTQQNNSRHFERLQPQRMAGRRPSLLACLITALSCLQPNAVKAPNNAQILQRMHCDE
jgi:hypothetical protein